MKSEKRLRLWQERLEQALAAYASERARMTVRDSYYGGAREVYRGHETGRVAPRRADNVRNIVYELIESEVDPSVPMPRVEAVHPGDEALAKRIEDMLRSLIREQSFSALNDLQERTVPIQGGAYWSVEWDAKGGSHCALGSVSVGARHPRQIVPQPGVCELEEMDYIFLCLAQPCTYLRRRYGVTLKGEDGETAGMCMQNIAYYRNGRGGIGLFSWAEGEVLADYEDYGARRIERCTRCGALREGEVCACGSRSFHEETQDYEELASPLVLYDGTVLSAEEQRGEEVPCAPDGRPLQYESGQTVVMPVCGPRRIPCYRPKGFPLVLRRNVRRFGTLLGVSDVDIIADQQDAVKKYGSKIDEKILKGGSFVTLPDGVRIETDGRELQVIRIRNPADKALIGVIDVQPDVTKELTALEQNYAWAKSTLGITDAFQGKYDSSAMSGTAKQFSAGQAAGRLQSKREMKNNAYAALYKLIFQFMLAYSDTKTPVACAGPDGRPRYTHFNRFDFLRRDDAGELYWDDEFIFSIDPSATLTSNRELLWNQLDAKFRDGAFGPINDKETLLRYWTQLSATGYPCAGQMKQAVAESLEQERRNSNAMSGLQNGDGDQLVAGDGGADDAEGGAGADAELPQPEL